MPRGKVDVSKRILDVLGEDNLVRWSELLRKTGVSKGALSTHLNKLIENELVARVVDESTRPPTVYYRCKRVYYTENLETLTPISYTFELLFEKARSLALFVKPAFKVSEAKDMIDKYPECLTYNLYSSKPIENEENFKKHVKLALMYILANIVEDPEYREKVADVEFNIHFCFNGDAVEKMLQEKEAEERKRVKIKRRPPPDPEDFIALRRKKELNKQ